MAWSPKSPDFGFLAKKQSLETLDSVSAKKLITYFRTTTNIFMTTSKIENSRTYPTSISLGLFLTLFGFLIFSIGAKPEWFNLDRSSVVGFIQIAVFMTGLGIITLGGYIALVALWGDNERSIAADIGLRLVATGYVLAIFTGMADVFGMGSHLFPEVPFFGPLQATGVGIGQAMIALGFLMTIPYGKWREK